MKRAQARLAKMSEDYYRYLEGSGNAYTIGIPVPNVSFCSIFI